MQLNSLKALTVDEKKVLTELAQGAWQTDAPELLGLSARTAKRHKTSASRKTSLDDRTELVIAALAAGVIPFPSEPFETKLTNDEIWTVQLVARGLSNEEVGARLFRSEDTIKSRLTKAMKPSGFKTRTHLAAAALRDGLIVAHGYDAAIPVADLGILSAKDRRKLQLGVELLEADGLVARIPLVRQRTPSREDLLEARLYLAEHLGAPTRFVQALKGIKQGLVQRPMVRPPVEVSYRERTILEVLATAHDPAAIFRAKRVDPREAAAIVEAVGDRLGTSGQGRVLTIVEAVHSQTISLDSRLRGTRRAPAQLGAAL